MSSQTIGLALSAKRQKLRIDKGQAADRIGMSRTTYSSYEQDRQRPSVDVFPSLAKFLEVSMEDFLILYGATAIVAVRPALEKVLLAQASRFVEPHRVEFDHVEGENVPDEAVVVHLANQEEIVSPSAEVSLVHIVPKTSRGRGQRIRRRRRAARSRKGFEYLLEPGTSD